MGLGRPPYVIVGGLCASGIKNCSAGAVESNASLDVLIVMPEHADGSSEPKETEDTAEVEFDGW